MLPRYFPGPSNQPILSQHSRTHHVHNIKLSSQNLRTSRKECADLMSHQPHDRHVWDSRCSSRWYLSAYDNARTAVCKQYMAEALRVFEKNSLFCVYKLHSLVHDLKNDAQHTLICARSSRSEQQTRRSGNRISPQPSRFCLQQRE